MQGIIDTISSTGKGFRIAGQPKGEWFNKGKMLDEDLIPSLKKGDSVEFTSTDGKWVTALKKVDGQFTAPVAPGLEKAKEVFKPDSARATDGKTEMSNSIARGCAANAVLGSPYMGEVLKGGSMEETVQNVKDMMEKVSEFVYGGKWNV